MIVFQLAFVALLAAAVMALLTGPTPVTATAGGTSSTAPARTPADHPFRSFAGAGTCVAWVGTLTDGGRCGRTPGEHRA